MATRTTKSADEKLENVDFDLFGAIAAIDRKDYGYWDRLTADQQRKFVPYMMLYWVSTIKNSGPVAQYYLRSTDYHANMHMFNERVSAHPQLQWYMLCAASPGMGKQFHSYVSGLSGKVAKLEEIAKAKDAKDHIDRMYPKHREEQRKQLAEDWLKQQHRKVYLAKVYPHLKVDDIDILNGVISDQEIEQYRRDCGE